jgi:hypothetical protein
MMDQAEENKRMLAAPRRAPVIGHPLYLGTLPVSSMIGFN